MTSMKAKIYSKAEHASKPGFVHVTFEFSPDNVAGFYLPAAQAAEILVGATVTVEITP